MDYGQQQQLDECPSSPSGSLDPAAGDDDRSSMAPGHEHHHHAPQPAQYGANDGYRGLPPIQHSMQAQPQYPPPAMNAGSNAQQMQPPQAAPYPPAQYPPPHPYQNGSMPAGAPPTSIVVANGAPPQNGQMMRFPIPQQPMDSRHISGGRHKKEIKRRTKTGCITCRKRRIKCDEAHPYCRNCQKSKRECMGYDPIFKQQPGPANIQPAPTANNAPAPPSQPSIHPNAPAPPSNPYPPSYPGTGGTFVPSGGEPQQQHQQQQQYSEYTSSPLDPALAGGERLHMAQNSYPAGLQQQRKVKMVSMDELFSLNDVPPQYNLREAPPPVSPATQSEVESFYKYHYSVGLDRLFETSWYSQRGLATLQRDALLQDFVAQCAEQMRAKTSDEATVRRIRSLEARLVWALAAMPRAVASSGPEPQLLELLPRIDTIESLLTGQFLDLHKVPARPQQPPSTQPIQEASQANQKYNEALFWHSLGKFASLRDDRPGLLKDVDDCLLSMRGILGMLENRDVFYSIAIARHFGGRMEGFHPQRHLVASTNDPNDEVNKLKVAHQFVETEDQRGTTQVIQRVCSMAIRGWILQKQ